MRMRRYSARDKVIYFIDEKRRATHRERLARLASIIDISAKEKERGVGQRESTWIKDRPR